MNNSITDKVILRFDQVLRGLIPSSQPKSNRPSPAAEITNPGELAPEQRTQSIAMFRVNHAGEICAQALYHGQALTAKTDSLQNKLLQAAAEETDHLYWCKQQLKELGGHTSRLDPVWYAGSFCIGAVVGFAGDKISLGFIAETEHQVAAHLTKHLAKLPAEDLKGRAILEQMRYDELQHAQSAETAGGQNLPLPIKIAMRFTAKIMTTTAAKF